MFLKKLEIQGFKSFAQKTILDFELGISAIVGPNGSGKSNIADALRFVLGEQGMRNVRVKKNEDLIFSGSGSKSKMNIAQATLYFDNSNKIFPVNFTEVSISRKIFRDGENQYFINNSQVRLKDLAEFISKAKLGLKGYTIINQGMGDHILNASEKERKEMVDEALGLREFQIKKNESILKLNQTKNNLEKTESIQRELSPHLKFLKKQVQKLEEKEKLEEELVKLEKKFVTSKFLSLKKEFDQKNKTKEELDKLLLDVQNSQKEISLKLEDEEKKVSGFFEDLEIYEKDLFKIESKKSELQRDLGKIEGAIDFQARSRKVVPQFTPISISHIKEKLSHIKNILGGLLKASSLDEMKKETKNLSDLFDGLLKDVESGKVSINSSDKEEDEGKDEIKKLKEEREKVLESLKETESIFVEIKEKIKDFNISHHKEKENIFNLRTEKKEKEFLSNKYRQELFDLSFKLGEIKRELEILDIKKDAFLKDGDFSENIASEDSSFGDFSGILREIERTKIKLETAELIDKSIIKEYEETKERLEFLEKETKDLEDATESLNSAIKKLELEVEDRFKKSFNDINKNFNKYFNILFGGGSAKLEIVSEKPSEGEDNLKKESVLGVDVSVSLPGKNVSSLSILSGGERTLSSLALLFALVSTSPPPFLVLDEVDAPLDEANASRFLKILDELKNQTQFVIITHNRETMRQADILYGVTMQEDGVSKLLSLKFNEAEEIIS